MASKHKSASLMNLSVCGGNIGCGDLSIMESSFFSEINKRPVLSSKLEFLNKFFLFKNYDIIPILR